VDPAVNNLVSAILHASFKRKFRSLAPWFRFYELLENLELEQKSLGAQQRKFAKIIILQDISRRLQNLNNWGWGPD
jgi:hypothetical protein